jgi:hypothetical protein
MPLWNANASAFNLQAELSNLHNSYFTEVCWHMGICSYQNSRNMHKLTQLFLLISCYTHILCVRKDFKEKHLWVVLPYLSFQCYVFSLGGQLIQENNNKKKRCNRIPCVFYLEWHCLHYAFEESSGLNLSVVFWSCWHPCLPWMLYENCLPKMGLGACTVHILICSCFAILLDFPYKMQIQSDNY